MTDDDLGDTVDGVPRCTSMRSDGSGRCRKAAMKGTTVCRNHGGATPQVRAAASRRLEQAARERVLAEGLAAAYGDDVPAVDPAEAMLQAVSWKYLEVVALRTQVAALDEESMVWGETRSRSGSLKGDGGLVEETVAESRPSVWWTMLRSAEEQLVKFAAAARAAGADERRLELEQQRVRLVAVAFGKALDSLELDDGQREAATRVLLAELRAGEDPGGPVVGEVEARG